MHRFWWHHQSFHFSSYQAQLLVPVEFLDFHLFQKKYNWNACCHGMAHIHIIFFGPSIETYIAPIIHPRKPTMLRIKRHMHVTGWVQKSKHLGPQQPIVNHRNDVRTNFTKTRKRKRIIFLNKFHCGFKTSTIKSFIF